MIHSHCDCMSPDEFEKLYNKAHVLPASYPIEPVILICTKS